MLPVNLDYPTDDQLSLLIYNASQKTQRKHTAALILVGFV